MGIVGVIIAACIGLSFAFACGATWHSLYGNHADARYLNPQLHEGVWQRQPVSRSDTAVVWNAVLASGATPDVREGHHHRPKVCTITNGMAHVDLCFCGKTRYGVYGSWS